MRCGWKETGARNARGRAGCLLFVGAGKKFSDRACND